MGPHKHFQRPCSVTQWLRCSEPPLLGAGLLGRMCVPALPRNLWEEVSCIPPQAPLRFSAAIHSCFLQQRSDRRLKKVSSEACVAQVNYMPAAERCN